MFNVMTDLVETSDSSPKHIILSFYVAGQEYGMLVSNVVQIIEMVTITKLPQVPDSIKGVINYHGVIVPVMDLRTRLNLPLKPYGSHTPIILVDFNDRVLGIVVDDVEEVLEIDKESITTSESFLTTELIGNESTSLQSLYLSGLAKINRRIVPLLQVNALLTKHEKKQLAKALPENSTEGELA